MKGNQKVIDALNVILKNELTAINQYFLHYKILEDQGLNKLAALVRAESIDEMKHAEQLITRILFLSGKPGMENMEKLRIGNDVKSIFENDLALEEIAIKDLRNAVKIAEDEGDNGSADLVESILFAEEEHVNFIETQLKLIENIGVPAYCQSQI